MLPSKSKTFGLSLACLIFLTGCELSLAQDIKPPENYQRVSLEQPSIEAVFTLPEESPNLSLGKAIFAESCAPCHGEFGVGGGAQEDKLPKLPPQIGSAEVAAQSSPVDWFGQITLGNIEALMPPFGEDLSVQERWDVMTYAYSLSDSQQLVESVLPEGMEITEGQLPDEIEPTQAVAATEASETVEETPVAGTPEVGDPLGIVRGTVTHGTGDSFPANLEVNLLSFDGFEPAFTLSSTAKSDGSFKFENIELAEQRIFFVTVSFEGASYSSQFDIMPEENELELPVTIFESTTDNSSLIITWFAMRFEFVNSGTVRMHLFYQVSNPSLQTVVSSSPDNPVMDYWLPENATNFSFEEEFAGDNFVITEQGFGDSSAIIAGVNDYTLAFAYDLPYDREISLGQIVNLPVDDFFVFLPKDGPKLDTEGFVETGETVIGDVEYVVFTNSDVQPSTVQIDVSGRSPKDSSAFLGLDINLNLAVSLSVLLAAILLAGLWISQNKRVQVAGEANPSVKILDAIIALDQEHESGFISEAAYLKKREELKAQLRELL